jgi:hypothetical protein
MASDERSDKAETGATQKSWVSQKLVLTTSQASAEKFIFAAQTCQNSDSLR